MIYLVLSAVCLALLYGVYRLALSRTTLHRFNRILLLSILVLSAVLPAVRIDGIKLNNKVADAPISKSVPQYLYADEYAPMEMVYEPSQMEEPVGAVTSVASQPDIRTSATTGVKMMEVLMRMHWITIITYLYLMGVAFFMIRLLIGIIRVETLCRLGGRKLSDGSVLLVCDGQFQPTSWRNTIIISRSDYESDNARMIIEHEQAHIHHRHSIDVLLAQIVCALQWFNPAAWALKRSLQEVHEYEADAAVLADGLNERQYQLCLVQAALSGRIGYVTSNFADCSTKKRITMMKRNQSSPFACFRALLLLPAVAVIILLASACKSDTVQDTSSDASAPAVEEPVVTPEPYDTLAFLTKFGYVQDQDDDIKIYQLNHFITIEADGSIWFNIAGQNNYQRAYLPSLDNDFEHAKSLSTVEVKYPEKVFVMYNRDNHLDICAEVIRQLQKSYTDENIIFTREPYIKSVPPAPVAMIDLKNDSYFIVTINENNEISFAGQWHKEGGSTTTLRSDTPIPSDNIGLLRGYINTTILEPNKVQGLKANLKYDYSCSGRVKKEAEKIMREYVNPPYLTYQVSYDLSSVR